MILKKKFLQVLVGRKNRMQHKCNRKLMGKKGEKYPAHQARVVQTLDSAIHRINRYPADSVIDLRNTYPLDSDLSGGSALSNV